MKSMEGMKQGKKGNKGFSLIEMIIVIAVMGVLIGLVGMQVTPYLNKARVAKDMQIISSYCTAAVTLYASKADNFAPPEKAGRTLIVSVYDSSLVSASFANVENGVTGNYKAENFRTDMKTLTGYASSDLLAEAMTSAEGQNIKDVKITFNFGKGTITAEAVDSSGKSLESFEPVESRISGGR